MCALGTCCLIVEKNCCFGIFRTSRACEGGSGPIKGFCNGISFYQHTLIIIICSSCEFHKNKK